MLRTEEKRIRYSEMTHHRNPYKSCRLYCQVSIVFPSVNSQMLDYLLLFQQDRSYYELNDAIFLFASVYQDHPTRNEKRRHYRPKILKHAWRNSAARPNVCQRSSRKTKCSSAGNNFVTFQRKAKEDFFLTFILTTNSFLMEKGSIHSELIARTFADQHG